MLARRLGGIIRIFWDVFIIGVLIFGPRGRWVGLGERNLGGFVWSIIGRFIGELMVYLFWRGHFLVTMFVQTCSKSFSSFGCWIRIG